MRRIRLRRKRSYQRVATMDAMGNCNDDDAMGKLPPLDMWEWCK